MGIFGGAVIPKVIFRNRLNLILAIFAPMDTINCILIDAEPLALNLLKTYVEKSSFLSLKATFGSGVEALAFINENPDIELVYLDIQISDLSGIELAKLLPPNVKIIFTAALEQYALEAHKFNTMGYLLKPFDYAEFIETSQKIFLNRAKKQTETAYLDDYFFVKSEYKQLRIDLDDLCYIEGLKDYVKLYVKSQPNAILTLMSLKKMERLLPADRFMRIHRSFIVSLGDIEQVERNQIIIGDKRITIADSYKERFSTFLKSKSL